MLKDEFKLLDIAYIYTWRRVRLIERGGVGGGVGVGVYRLHLHLEKGKINRKGWGGGNRE